MYSQTSASRISTQTTHLLYKPYHISWDHVYQNIKKNLTINDLITVLLMLSHLYGHSHTIRTLEHQTIFISSLKMLVYSQRSPISPICCRHLYHLPQSLILFSPSQSWSLLSCSTTSPCCPSLSCPLYSQHCNRRSFPYAWLEASTRAVWPQHPNK